ncbi:hypothetical protein [Pseudanabaena yagii]|uniref:Uncharacterized protein n=1 Tax=Pseudanabaena yagii GIHE-NHR1 TaxID=2722753 RepID=A0ABX1LQ41_9CYAN|nr:hypothetical protein [Pseudanabaena yagii]NMF58234.1 hypothetical protein [Pseudanabaena yagii GIHE-NHR1]
MNTQEATIEVLQNRIKYLEAHLHLALQVLGEMENDLQDFSIYAEAQGQISDRAIDVVPTSEVKLPTFLNSRTWKHNHPEMMNLHDSRDRSLERLVVNAS